CHNLAGEGIGANPPLDNPGLKDADPTNLFKIISRGLYGTSMPAWNVSDGGGLSDYQIGELVDLIQFGDWEETHDRVINLGLAPMVPRVTEPDAEILAGFADMPGGDTLTLGVTVYAQQCVACHGADGLGTDLAPALNAPEVKATPLDELERIIRSGVPSTLMAGWEKVLTDEEISATITLITQWDQVAVGAIPTPDEPLPVTEESLALGADLYAANCSRCHATEGQGTPRAPSLNVKGYLEATNDAALQQIITLGVPGTSMPAWGDKMLESEIQALVGFIRSWEATAPAVAEPARGGGGGPWWQTEGGSPPGRGGKGHEQGGPPADVDHEQETIAEEGVPAEDVHEPGAEAQGHEIATPQAHEEGQGGPPAEAGQGQEHDHTAGETPPWMVEESQSWWEAMDARAWGLVLGSAIIALALMTAAFWGLSRMPVPAKDENEPMK
ncbi:MAG: c-type cytochrome, partial [Chloroflexota bacterium]|nr:c-type cytochrome [Chloroflexota bacterium]